MIKRMMKMWVDFPKAGVLWGGNSNNGANDGLAYVNANNAPSNSNANIGSHHVYNCDKK